MFIEYFMNQSIGSLKTFCRGVIGILKISVSPIAYPLNIYFINYLMAIFELIHFLKEIYAEKKIHIILISISIISHKKV